MTKQSQSDQKWASIRKNLDDNAERSELSRESTKILSDLNINQDQEAAIKLISQRAGDQIGQLMASLIEDTLILILAGQHPNLSPSIMPSRPNLSPPPYKLLKAIEVAKALDISRTQAYLFMRRGDIPTVRIGKSTRVRPEDLDNFIKANNH